MHLSQNIVVIAQHTGRILLGLYFLLPGLAKVAAWQTHIEMMQQHNIPAQPYLLVIATIANLAGGTLLIANRYVSLTALGCACYVLVINVSLHDFWNFAGIEAAHETQNFVKNLGILAGLLVLASLPSHRATAIAPQNQ